MTRRNSPVNQPPEQEVFFVPMVEHGGEAGNTTTLVTPEEAANCEATQQTEQTVEEPQIVYAALADRRTHAHLLSQAVDALGERNKARGYTKGAQHSRVRQKLEETSDGPVDMIAPEKARHAELDDKAARTNFMAAYLLGMEVTPETISHAEKYAEAFAQKYGGKGPRAQAERAKLRELLAAAVAIEGPKAAPDRYEKVFEEDLSQAKDKFADKTPLTTIEKQIALRGEPRFGGLAATHREKNSTLDMMDYDESPEHPLAQTDQLEEIHKRRQRETRQEAEKLFPGNKNDREVRRKRYEYVRRQNAGNLAVQSVAHERVDYFEDAVEQLATLQKIEEVINNSFNLRITLPEALEDAGLDIDAGALVRFIDLDNFVRTGKLPVGFDPMLTREDRTSDHGPGKNKKVEDLYTQKERHPMVEQHIQATLASIPLYKLHDPVRMAVSDQFKRMNGHKRIMYGSKGHPASRPVIDAALVRHNLPLFQQQAS